MPDPASPADVALPDYEYIQSSGAHGHHAVGVFDAFVGSQREIWMGSDGSGLIREASGPASFFTEEGRGAGRLLAVRSSPMRRVSISSRRGACPAPVRGVPESPAIPMGWRRG
jgi:hypothetical protein